MRITQWGEYGLLCSMYIAEQTKKGNDTVGAAEIADSLSIALQYTQQILQRLRKGDIIDSVRGPHGGYKLTRPSTDISVANILTAAEGDTFEVICETKPIDSERCGSDTPCSLRNLWVDLKDHINEFLTAKTLEELIAPQNEQPIQIGPPCAAHSSSEKQPLEVSRTEQA